MAGGVFPSKGARHNNGYWGRGGGGLKARAKGVKSLLAPLFGEGGKPTTITTTTTLESLVVWMVIVIMIVCITRCDLTTNKPLHKNLQIKKM